MRKPLAISLVLSSTLGGPAAMAAPQGAAAGAQCVDTGCFIDEVLVIKGEETGADGAPLVACEGTDCNLGKDKAEYLSPAAIDRAAAKAVAVAATKGAMGPWHEVVVFTADFGTPKGKDNGMPPQDFKQAGPLFYRARNEAKSDINEVQGIGLNVVMRDASKPYVGMISAGTSKNTTGTADSAFGKVFGAGANGNFNKACDESTNSVCFKDIYTYYDALAQATAQIYAPYLPGLTSMPVGKANLVAPGANAAAPPTAKIPEIATNIWNSLLNTGGSLMGGNTWRDKGNGTWEVARPTAFQGVSAPFENSQVLRFMPLDLYMLGFVPQKELRPIGSFKEASPATIYAPASSSSFGAAVGPGMGVKISGVALRTSPKDLTLEACQQQGMNMMPSLDCMLPAGARSPAADNGAPQAIKQLWVVVTRPGATPDVSKAEVVNVAKARRQFQHYFYNLAQYRGRVSTTVDGEDDSGYFEFGDSDDDKKEFEGRGGNLDIPGVQEIPNSGGRAITVARISGSGLAFKPTADRKIRILGSGDIPLKNNVATTRLRLPASGDKLKGKLTFVCAGGNKDYDVPNGEGNLLADGKFHNYSIPLDTEGKGWKDASCTGVEFTLDNNSELEVDFIKVANASDSNLKDEDKECNGKTEKTDGWLALEDNCPKVYNPGQEDGNGDGVGDACEDYDGDNVVNSCDNCPTVTNSSQRDANNNKQGDACDGSQAETCFFSGSTVAGTGAAPTSASLWAGLGVFGMMVAGAIRRRRRRK